MNRAAPHIYFSIIFIIFIMINAPRSFAARYAVLAANNRGWGSEKALQYANQDALRFANILEELGEFQRQNVAIITDAAPWRIENALREIAGRIQKNQSEQNLFLFFYSGHADEESLHPGPASLSYKRLKELIAQIPASVRVAILDSCKSGGLTNIKGAKAGPAFDIQLIPSDQITGDVFITSATVNENAQESTVLQGSFFSNYVAAGLRGAADTNNDGRVTLAETYAYAYTQTVGLTSGTRGGTQHPTFYFDLKGRGQLMLTRPQKSSACILFDRGAERRRPGRGGRSRRAADAAPRRDLPARGAPVRGAAARP